MDIFDISIGVAGSIGLKGMKETVNTIGLSLNMVYKKTIS